ncbi:hypothetical protein BB560_005210 [Smittium megazygosporum]|uniref:Uncharacterized protein n=1 Tax=Smittium megazygosporum TaxID=133381 RepID=A0A2T9Z743_9FUNG|nr:hypothetical protein BB560_005210 [Smittium megazygosporum]
MAQVQAANSVFEDFDSSQKATIYELIIYSDNLMHSGPNFVSGSPNKQFRSNTTDSVCFSHSPFQEDISSVSENTLDIADTPSDYQNLDSPLTNSKTPKGIVSGKRRRKSHLHPNSELEVALQETLSLGVDCNEIFHDPATSTIHVKDFRSLSRNNTTITPASRYNSQVKLDKTFSFAPDSIQNEDLEVTAKIFFCEPLESSRISAFVENICASVDTLRLHLNVPSIHRLILAFPETATLDFSSLLDESDKQNSTESLINQSTAANDFSAAPKNSSTNTQGLQNCLFSLNKTKAQLFEIAFSQLWLRLSLLLQKNSTNSSEPASPSLNSNTNSIHEGTPTLQNTQYNTNISTSSSAPNLAASTDFSEPLNFAESFSTPSEVNGLESRDLDFNRFLHTQKIGVADFSYEQLVSLSKKSPLLVPKINQISIIPNKKSANTNGPQNSQLDPDSDSNSKLIDFCISNGISLLVHSDNPQPIPKGPSVNEANKHHTETNSKERIRYNNSSASLSRGFIEENLMPSAYFSLIAPKTSNTKKPIAVQPNFVIKYSGVLKNRSIVASKGYISSFGVQF